MEQITEQAAVANRTAQGFLLPDGRQLGYAEYGKPDGFPVFLFHGTPGSRLWFMEDDAEAHALGVRLIATDRPGYGLSDPKPGRSILDYPKDIEALADGLGIERFSLIGASGGSVYAAACAYALPEKVVTAGLVAGISQFEKGKPPKEMCSENRSAFFLSRYFPWLIRYSLNSGRKLMHTKPEKYIQAVQSQVKHLCSFDREIIQRESSGKHLLMHMQEAFRQNVRESATEPALLARPWGFDCRDIRAPVQIWHGTEDTLAPFEPMKEMARQLQACQTHFIEGMGHFLDGDPEIWKQILQSVLPKKHDRSE